MRPALISPWRNNADFVNLYEKLFWFVGNSVELYRLENSVSLYRSYLQSAVEQVTSVLFLVDHCIYLV